MAETMNKKAYQCYTQELEIWAGDICRLPPHGSHPFG